MMITRENYEFWFLDFLEGRLNRQDTEEIRQFMRKHPDLAEELENFVPPLTSDPGLHFPGKEKLKKDPFDVPDFLENSIIALMEGDLDETEIKSLNDWLNRHPEKKQCLAQFENTRLQPDFKIVFPGKESLKKKDNQRIVWLRIASIAAVMLLAFYLFYPANKINDQPVAAAVESIVPTREIEPSGQSQPRTKTSPSLANKLPVFMASNTSKLSGKAKGSSLDKSYSKSLEERSYTIIPILEARTVRVNSVVQEFSDLMPVREPGIQYAAGDEILMSRYLSERFQEMKAGGTGGILSREGLTIAGLRLFSWLPGHRLTGKKGSDGRLRSINFNTQLLAFSIPVNREL